MTTKLWYPGTGGTLALTKYLGVPSPWETSQTGSTAPAWFNALTAQSTQTQSSPTAGTLTGPQDLLLCRMISPPIDQDVTISGTVTFNFWGSENSMSANAGFRGVVYQLKAVDGTLQQIVASSRGTELGTSNAVHNWTATPTSTALLKGDRLVVEMRMVDTGGTMASGFIVTVSIGGNTAGSSGDSWVQFNETFGFQETAPSGTIFYLTQTASDVATADDDRALATSRTGLGYDAAFASSAAGPVSPIRLQKASTDIRWYSPALTGLTLQGPILLNIRPNASAVPNNATVGVKLITRDAGGTETDLAFGLVPASSVGVVPSVAVTLVLGCADTVLSDGWRLGVLLYTDDSVLTNMTTGRTIAIEFGGNASSDGDTWLQLSSTVTPFTAAAQVPRRDPYSQLLAQAREYRERRYTFLDGLWRPDRRLVTA